MWCDHPNDICHFSRTRIELTIFHLIVIITSVHIFEIKPLSLTRFWTTSIWMIKAYGHLSLLGSSNVLR